MNASLISRSTARTIIPVALAVVSALAGLAAGPLATAAASDGGWYVVVDEQGNAVVPEWKGIAPAGQAAASVGYAIVGEDGAAYVPEQVGGNAPAVVVEASKPGTAGNGTGRTWSVEDSLRGNLSPMYSSSQVG
jgi:hypothetical protein